MTSTQPSSDDKKQTGYIFNPLGHVAEKNKRKMFLDWGDVNIDKIQDEMPNLYQAILSIDKIQETLNNDINTISLNAFKNELLPLFMSVHPEENKYAIDCLTHIAGGRHKPLDVVDEYGKVIVRLPGAYSPIQTQENDTTKSISSYLNTAFIRDQRIGTGASPETDGVLNSIFQSDEAIFDYQFLFKWDVVLMMFGYPSFFTENEREYLGLPEVELYPGCEPITLPHPIVPEGKVSARAKRKQGSSAAPSFTVGIAAGGQGFDEYDDDDTEWGD